MSIKTDKTEKLNLSQVSFGYHGQMSVILLQIRYYFVCKGKVKLDVEQALLKVLCFNIKHFLELSAGQNFLEHEKNTYAYYKEKITETQSGKKIFLDLLSHQILLSNEYKSLQANSLSDLGIDLSQILLESKVCENVIKAQIQA